MYIYLCGLDMIYKSDLVLAIAQLRETRLDLQKSLPANTSVIFVFSYVHHYISFCLAGITLCYAGRKSSCSHRNSVNIFHVKNPDFLLKVFIYYIQISVENTKMNLFAIH